ncbi:MAG TPA: peptidylprolyl isomerase [Candidatus Binataceae bacterium]
MINRASAVSYAARVLTCAALTIAFALELDACTFVRAHTPSLPSLPFTKTAKPITPVPSTSMANATPVATPEAAPTPAAAVAAEAPVAMETPMIIETPREPAPAGSEVNRVVGSVDGDPITMHDVTQYQAGALSETGKHITPDVALKSLVIEKLLEQETKKYEDRIDEGQVDKYIEQLRHERNMTDAQFRQQLTQNGMSYDDFRKKARTELEKMEMIQTQVREKVNIPQSDIQVYYDGHKNEFTIDKERLRIAQILIAVPPNATPRQRTDLKKKAEALRQRAIKGEDFYELARHYSDDESKKDGGELGWFAPADIMDEILAGVKPLKPGEVSQVVQTKNGYHVLRLEDHEVPGVQPLADVQGKIRDKLQDERAQATFETWVQTELIKQHYVETNL